MRALLPIVASIALVACTSDSQDNTNDPTQTEQGDSAAKAKQVSLEIEGMT